MGLRDLFTGGRKAAQVRNFTNAWTVPPYEWNRWLDTALLFVDHQSPGELFRTQPYLRMVITFLARNIAQLGLHTFERVSDTDRQRLTDDPVAQLLAHPNPTMTCYELIYTLVADLSLYDVAYWNFGSDTTSPSGWSIRPIPPAWVENVYGGDAWAVGGIVVNRPNGTRQQIPASDLQIFHGWNPDDPAAGSAPIWALREILKEQISAWAYRQQVWDRGGRVGAVLTRPATAPTWADPARDRFREDWRNRYASDDGTQAGGTPILEDGMTLQRVGFSAREDDWVNAAKLSLATVAGVYHINPTMVGLLDNANYSNVREFRRMLYGDTLGPILAQIEDRLNTFVVPRVGTLPNRYVEFNIGEKLQGSFEEQSQALSTLVGAPSMTRNEGRALLNLPAVEGGDELVTPLNVLTGGQASPTDTAPPPPKQLRALSGPKEAL